VSGATVEHEGVTYHALPSQGAFFGVSRWNGRDYLMVIAMQTDGSPDLTNGAGEVCNFDERWGLLDEINALLGTTFPRSAFPGR
jgi:hypothetical protein